MYISWTYVAPPSHSVARLHGCPSHIGCVGSSKSVSLNLDINTMYRIISQVLYYLISMQIWTVMAESIVSDLIVNQKLKILSCGEYAVLLGKF